MSAVSREDIRRIPLLFAIGKRPLSIVLGWGELTYTRLLEGKNPTPAHAAELRRLLDDPAAYARILEIGRGKITDMAYRRSFAAVDEMLSEQGGVNNVMRIYAVADRLCELSQGDLTPSALQRLAYYAQGMALARTGELLFDDLPRAGAAGPTYDRLSEMYSYAEIQRSSMAANPEGGEADGHAQDDDAQEPFPFTVLTQAQIEMVDLAYSLYGKFSGQELSRMSREESPWRKARKRGGAKNGADCDEPITAKSMRKYFSKARA